MSAPKATVGLADLQARTAEWCTATYGAQTLLERIAILTEELGEVSRAILKAHQRIRPSDRGNLAEELPDLLIALLVTAEIAGIDMASAVEARFLTLQGRSVEREEQR